MKHRILVINPGSTSTKIAVFEGKEKLFDTTLRYSTEELASFGWVMEQVDFRRATIEKALADNNIDPDSLDAICARGGQVPYCAAGTYRVDQAMVDFMYTRRQGAHASNLGCVLALLLAKPLGIPAYIVDPVMVDEMDDVARVSGLPELPRKMQGHALNCRAMAIRCADEALHKPLADCRLIVLHLGGGGLHGGRARRARGRPRRRVDVRARALRRRGDAGRRDAVLLRQVHRERDDGLCPRQGRPCGAPRHVERHRG